MKGALIEKTFGAIEAPAEKLDCEPTDEERWKCASRAEYGLARREPVAAQHLIEIRLPEPEHRVLEPRAQLDRLATVGRSRRCISQND
jgi:hypothetical protein